MNSESLYRYSIIHQHRPGFTSSEDSRPELLWEYTGEPWGGDQLNTVLLMQSMGLYACSRGQRLSRIPLSAYDLLYVYSGQLVLFSERKRTALEDRDVMLIQSGTPYELLCSSDAQILLLSHYGVVGEKFYGLICREKTQKIDPRSHKIVEELLEKLENYNKYPTQVRDIFSMSVMTQLLTELYLSTLEPESYTVLGHPKWLQTVLEYMERNYHKPISVEDLADLCSMSGSHFHKLFRQNMQTSPYNYLLQLRISKAKLLLKNGDIPIKAVAHSVGIPSANHFIAHFRSLTGVTPEEYRRLLSEG